MGRQEGREERREGKAAVCGHHQHSCCCGVVLVLA